MTSLETFIKQCFNDLNYEIQLPEVKIYYSKKDYVLIRGTEDEIINKIKRGKDIIYDWCKLNKFIKDENKISDKINKILYKYFCFDTNFKITLKDGIVKISYMNYSENINTFEYNYEKYKDFPPIYKTFLKCSSYKELNKILPSIVYKVNGKEIKNYYLEILSKSLEYYNFIEIIKKIKKEYDEVIINLNKGNISFYNNSFDLDNYLNTDKYYIEFIDNNIFIKSSLLLFRISKKIKPLYSVDYFDRVLNKLKMINIIYYDINTLLKNNNYNSENISFNIDDDKFYISDYTTKLEFTNYKDIYSFVESLIDKIKDSEKLSNEKLKKYIIMYVHNVNNMMICADSTGTITMSSYISLFNNVQEAILNYYSLGNVINMLKKLDIVESFSFINKNDYTVTFTDEARDIIKYDCYELRESALSMIPFLFTLEESIEYIPSKYTPELLNNVDDLKILSLLDNEQTCKKYYELLKTKLLNIDKKYYPILKMKLKKIDSKQVLGNLYNIIEKICGENQ